MNFTYSGTDLAPALERLLRHLLDEKKRMHSDVTKYAHSNENEIVVWAATPPAMATNATAERNAKARSYMLMLGAIRETELWLYEARRVPTAQWTLSLTDLERLYPATAFPETTVDSLLRTPETSPPARRPSSKRPK